MNDFLRSSLARFAPARARVNATKALPGLLFVALLVGVYGDPLFFHRVFAGRDPLGYHYPVEKAVHDAWARGHLPVWISEISGGRPLLANPNVGAFYPIRPLVARLPFPFVIRIFPILHWAIAGLGILRLLRLLGVSPAGAWLGAVTFVFSGVSVSEVFYPNIHPGMALLPWIVAETAAPRWSRRSRTVILGSLLGLLGLVGDVFSLGLAVVGAVLWVLAEVPREERSSRFVPLGGALPLAGLLAAPQIAASAAWIPQTNRAVLGMNLGEVLLYSLSPWRLAEFIIPFPFGSTWELDNSRVWGWPLFQLRSVGFFTSLYAGAFAAIAVVLLLRIRARGARFARALFVFGLAASVLPSFVPRVWRSLPSPIPLRYPEKFAVALALALAIAAGLAADHLRRLPRSPRWPLAVGGALAILALTAAIFSAASGRAAVVLIGADGILAPVASARLPGALAEAGLLWMATVVAIDLWPRAAGARTALALILLTVVPILGTRRIARSFREEEILAPTPFARMVARADPGGLFRVFGESPYRTSSLLEGQHLSSDVAQIDSTRRSWIEYTGTLWRRGTVFNFDFDSGDLSRMESLRRVSAMAASYRDSGAFFGSLALRFGIRARDQESVSGFRPIRTHGIEVWDQLSGALPAIRLATSWREVAGAVEALQVLPLLSADEIVVESGSRRAGRAGAGTVRLVEDLPERMIVETSVPDPTWLFALRGYWTDRRVLVDGRETSSSPAQLAFSAVPIPAGRHRVEWSELAPGWTTSRFGPLAFLAAVLLLGLGGRGSRKTA